MRGRKGGHVDQSLDYDFIRRKGEVGGAGLGFTSLNNSGHSGRG